MGMVYRARYVVKGIEVALKMLPNDVQDSTALARFEQEMEVLKTLRHPNIVRCFGGKCEDKQRFYAMELIRNGSLEEELNEVGRMTWEKVIEYGLQMCGALDYSHGKGIIHRDVKPSNFLVADDKTLRLSDFGLAAVAAKRRLTAQGKTAGTFLYMAPEQIRGGEITPQTDIYALGCVFFELLTGQPPFVGDTPAATLHMHCKSTPPRPTEFALDCPPALETLVLRMLEKNPQQRPESAAEVARELRGVGTAIHVVSKPNRLNHNLNQPTPLPESLNCPQTELHSRVLHTDTPRPRWRRTLDWLAPLLAVILIIWNVSLLRSGSDGERSLDLWLEASRHEHEEVRLNAAYAMENFTEDRHVSRLMTMLEHDESSRVRETAANSIGNLGGAANQHIPALLRAQKKEADSRVRIALAEALKQVRGQ